MISNFRKGWTIVLVEMKLLKSVTEAIIYEGAKQFYIDLIAKTAGSFGTHIEEFKSLF